MKKGAAADLLLLNSGCTDCVDASSWFFLLRRAYLAAYPPCIPPNK